MLSDLWIKICGITRNEDARAAVDCGADALGIVLYPPSPRAVEPSRIPEIMAGLPADLRVYALFVDPDPEEVEAVLAVAEGVVNRLQFHGQEPEQFCASFGLHYMKALRVGAGDNGCGSGDSERLRTTIAGYSSAESILLDSFHPSLAGGSGEAFDWNRFTAVQQMTDCSLVLAGGLDVSNVAAAVLHTNPDGVDVSSGVEVAPGRKDPGKLQSFINAARAVGATRDPRS